MKDFKILRVLDRLRGLFSNMGIDYPVMRRILHTKLLMDSRRVPTLFNQSARKKPTKDVNHFIRSLWFYVLVGLVIMLFMMVDLGVMFKMTGVFAILLFMLMTVMISEFSSVLLDVRDQDILLSKPITVKTLSAAKALHVSIYLFFLTGALAVLPLGYLLFCEGFAAFLIFLVSLILLNFLVLFVTSVLYLSILHFFDGETLRDVINYVQIGMAIGIFVGYQVVLRAFEFTHLHVAFDPSWWHYALPPVWFAAPFAWLGQGHFQMNLLVLTLLAVVVSIGAIMCYIKLLPVFEEKMQKLNEGSDWEKKVLKDRKFSLSRVICRSEKEQALFTFAHRMMNKERQFKLKVYPALGFSIAIPFILIFNQLSSMSWSQLTGSSQFLAIYFSMIMLPQAVLMLNYSGQYKGAWLFKTIPLKDATLIYKSVLKAVLTKLFLPVFMLESLLFIIIFGWRVLPHLAIVLLASFLYTQICFPVMLRQLPFSESFESMQQSQIWKAFPLWLLILLLWGVHFAVLHSPLAIWLYLAVLLVGNVLCWQILFRWSKSWQTV